MKIVIKENAVVLMTQDSLKGTDRRPIIEEVEVGAGATWLIYPGTWSVDLLNKLLELLLKERK